MMETGQAVQEQDNCSAQRLASAPVRLEMSNRPILSASKHSRHLSRREAAAPWTLLDYFDDFVCFVDESP
jgi:excinuclease UvrABC helicase subunit UvrB